MTTLDVILENKERREPIAVYERMRGTNHRTGQAVDDFTGAYRYEKGRIIPFDGDSYSVYQEIIDYAWANNSQLTVWYQGDYLTAEEFDAELKKFAAEQKDEIEKIKNGR